LYYHRHRLLLPAFPTRRSSDLVNQMPPVVLESIARLFAAGVVATWVTDKLGSQHFLVRGVHGLQTHRPADVAAVPWSFPQFESEDRKSTRLNSSHVSISYAVFC